MKRKIISIDKDLCNGCGLCIAACHEGALEMVDGKARLVSDSYCDGLGDCLPECPTGAIEIIEREAAPFDEELVQQRMAARSGAPKMNGGRDCNCPGAAAGSIEREEREQLETVSKKVPSALRQWPIQLNLVNPAADYFEGADVLVAADCCAYAYGGFHTDFMQGRIVLIGCPKLDDSDFYMQKLVALLRRNCIKSLTVVRMEVPCCGGLTNLVKRAMLEAGIIVPYQEFTLSIRGEVVS